MADKLRSLVKVIGNGVYKHRLLKNARFTFGSATESAQKKLNNVQSIAAMKYDAISKQINSETTIFQDVNAAPLQTEGPLPKKIVKWYKWFHQLSGLEAVELSRQQVIISQDKLFKCQEDRRLLNREVTILNEKLKEIYGELVQTKRDDPKYVQLTIIENKALQEQARIISHLNLLEKEEQEQFTLLATAIKEYHVSQALNAQKYKYLSILASALLAIVSLTASMIYNNKRIMDVRHVIDKAQEKNEMALNKGLSSIEYSIHTRFSKILGEITKNRPVTNPEDALEQRSNVSEDPKTVPGSYYSKVGYTVGIGFFSLLLLKMMSG